MRLSASPSPDFTAAALAHVTSATSRTTKLDTVLTEDFQRDGFATRPETMRYHQLVEAGAYDAIMSDIRRAAELITIDVQANNDPFKGMLEGLLPAVEQLSSIGSGWAFESGNDGRGRLQGKGLDAFRGLEDLRERLSPVAEGLAALASRTA